MSEPYYKQEYQGERKLDGEAPVFSFGQIMKETFLRPFTWNARTTRRSFWIGIIVSEILIWIGGIITFCATLMPVSHYENDSVDMINGFAFNSNHISAIVIIGMIIWGLIYLYLKLCQLGLAVRRLHDINYTGWWILLMLISLGWIFVLYFAILPSKQEPVKWGTYLYLDE